MSNLTKIHKELTLLIVDIGHLLLTQTGYDEDCCADLSIKETRRLRNKLKEIRRLVKEDITTELTQLSQDMGLYDKT